MALLQPRLAVMDETDSGLDIDALRIVSHGVNSLRGPDRAVVVVTHYQRLLNYIVPDFVHVLERPNRPLRRQGAGHRARGKGLRLDRGRAGRRGGAVGAVMTKAAAGKKVSGNNLLKLARAVRARWTSMGPQAPPGFAGVDRDIGFFPDWPRTRTGVRQPSLRSRRPPLNAGPTLRDPSPAPRLTPSVSGTWRARGWWWSTGISLPSCPTPWCCPRESRSRASQRVSATSPEIVEPHLGRIADNEDKAVRGAQHGILRGRRGDRGVCRRARSKRRSR